MTSETAAVSAGSKAGDPEYGSFRVDQVPTLNLNSLLGESIADDSLKQAQALLMHFSEELSMASEILSKLQSYYAWLTGFLTVTSLVVSGLIAAAPAIGIDPRLPGLFAILLAAIKGFEKVSKSDHISEDVTEAGSDIKISNFEVKQLLAQGSLSKSDLLKFRAKFFAVMRRAARYLPAEKGILYRA